MEINNGSRLGKSMKRMIEAYEYLDRGQRVAVITKDEQKYIADFKKATNQNIKLIKDENRHNTFDIVLI